MTCDPKVVPGVAYGFVARVFEVFDRHRTPVDLIATSEVSISLTVDDSESLPLVERGLAGLADMKVLRGMAIVWASTPAATRSSSSTAPAPGGASPWALSWPRSGS